MAPPLSQWLSEMKSGLPDDFKEKKPNLQEIKPKIKPNQNSLNFAKKLQIFTKIGQKSQVIPKHVRSLD